jgi:ATP-binding cassette subfamily F protein uup
MSLLSLVNVTFTWDADPVLDDVSLEIEAGQRIGLLGRNGAGKSTLMKLFAGELDPDEGTIRREKGCRVARLVQEVPPGTEGTIAEIVGRGVSQEHLAEKAHLVAKILSRMQLDGGTRFRTLSSGMKRRVLLAQSLVEEPDVLLLDEPTNHLDIDAIRWLENFLQVYSGTLIFVTHDREFLQALATRIIELDRGRLFDWTCDYQTFLKRKAAALEAEEKQNALFDKKLADEEIWIRQGIKARRTRNEGRVRALKQMREQRRQRREKIGNVKLRAVESQRSGQLVIAADEISFAYGEQPIIDDYSTLISRGDRIGIIGPNGAGKTTLLKLLLKELAPDAGTVRHGTNLDILYFDQLREQIAEDKTVVEIVGEGQEILSIDGQRKHIYGYLQDFLFTPERARRPARSLSGGERNRLLLARLFKRSSNLLVLDEPTNDLDLETLELLEELLANYGGTLLLVSHDRAFLNNVVTGIIAVEGHGVIREVDGGYDDYLRIRSQIDERQSEKLPSEPEPATPSKTVVATKQKKKLSYNEQRELEQLPHTIEQLETEQSDLAEAMSDPEFFKQDSEQIAAATNRMEELTAELASCYERWEELEAGK